MKIQRGDNMRRVIFLLMIGMLLFACKRANNEIPAKMKEKIASIGASASQDLLKTLKSHLMEAMQQEELVDAFEFCAVQAIPLTEEVNDRLPQTVEVKRVSLKFRNPANKPDPMDEEALKSLANSLAQTDSLPKFLIMRERDHIYRYYKPLQIAKPCLKCHGARETIDEQVLNSLRENYPEDNALNYKLGDLRGAVRVRIKL